MLTDGFATLAAFFAAGWRSWPTTKNQILQVSPTNT